MDLKISSNVTDNEITILVKGRIDSSNYEKFFNDCVLIIEKDINCNRKVVFDLEQLEYISSAGLRDFLKFKKAYNDMRIINASPEVYSVFEMTGFTSLIDIVKAFRTVSVKGLECIGEGYVGKVYRLDEDKIIKVFMRINSIEDIYRERDRAKKAFVLGLPTAMSYELVKVKEGGFGSIFEMVNSACLNVLINNNLDKYEEYRDMYIKLLDQIMSIEVANNDLPEKRLEPIQWAIALTKWEAFEPEVLIKLTEMFNKIPSVNRLVHGDFHVKNIMLQDGEPILIDMETLGVGHPIFEISAFYLSYIGYPSTEKHNVEDFLGIPDSIAKRLYKDTFDHLFFKKSEEEKIQIQEKIELFSYAWLTYKTYENEPNNLKRLKHSKEMVLSLINKYQDFSF